MSTAFAAEVRARARAALRALADARRDDDTHAILLAEEEWEDVRRLAQAHAITIDTDEDAA